MISQRPERRVKSKNFVRPLAAFDQSQARFAGGRPELLAL